MTTNAQDIQSAKGTIDKEIDALRMMEEQLEDSLCKALDIIHAGGDLRKRVLRKSTVRHSGILRQKRLLCQGSQRARSGTLGLAIAENIASIHKGTLRAESDAVSTRFTFTMPLRK